ncbi:MAG: S1 RNA-binding domain-containing protein [Candidatus Heimdallarchaeota archaeon]|nr:MAG: S1 RNA-binding domain-containing protein [Candidatus Heimdallarchaeota archaeon]
MELNFPRVGELVIGTCTKLTPHGAYFEIFDYEKLGSEAGFVHISELSRTWVRNIRSHIREGQRAVSKILRVDTARGEIDMSIRRVSEPQRRMKLNEFKQENRARGIVAVACENVDISAESVEETLLGNFNSIYEGLIKAREGEVALLTEIGIPEVAAKKIHQLAVKELQPPTVQLAGLVTITCYESNGVEILKEFFKTYNKSFNKKHKGSKINIQIISPPEYRCMIESGDWKTAEGIWKEIQEESNQFFSPYDAECSFERQ